MVLSHILIQRVARLTHAHPWACAAAVGLVGFVFRGCVSIFCAILIGCMFLVKRWVFLGAYATDRHKYATEAVSTSHVQGRLFYDGDVPVLELSGENAFQDGYAHGYLCAQQIAASMRNFDIVLRSTGVFPRAEQVPDVVARIITNLTAVHEDFYEELRGLSRGFNRRMTELGQSTRMTADDALMMHLIPDSKHLHPFRLQSVMASPACTCVVLRSREQDGSSITFGRCLDWLSFGVSGENSILVVWKRLGIASFTVPGLIGVVTGWNRSGLCMAMNVCPGETTEVPSQGLPAIFANRLLLESCINVAETCANVDRGSVVAIGPYHLTLGDPLGQAACISFRQNSDGTHHIRHAKPSVPLAVVNWRYPECSGGTFNSEGRMCLLNEHFRRSTAASDEEAVMSALQLPLINSWITLQCFLFAPSKMEVRLCWNNSFAATGPFHVIRMDRHF